MYKTWATVNIFIVSFLHLLQGSDYENGSVKVGDLYLLSFLIQIARIAYISRARWWSFCCFGAWGFFCDGLVAQMFSSHRGKNL